MFWRVQQHPDPVAQQVDRGLEPGRQHQARGGPKFDVAEVRTFVGRLDQLAHQVVTGVAPQLLKVICEPDVEPLDACIDLVIFAPGQAEVQTRRAQLAELQDAGPGLIRHAEDVADDGDG